MRRQYEQYNLSKENIEIINRKYHDLKHQIAVVRAERNSDKREQYLQEMENDIKMYEAQNKTGNKVLDTILTGKHLYCVQHEINFTCVADGMLLDFMNLMDICTIFGNALDNAIECVEKIGDKSKRPGTDDKRFTSNYNEKRQTISWIWFEEHSQYSGKIWRFYDCQCQG